MPVPPHDTERRRPPARRPPEPRPGRPRAADGEPPTRQTPAVSRDRARQDRSARDQSARRQQPTRQESARPATAARRPAAEDAPRRRPPQPADRGRRPAASPETLRRRRRIRRSIAAVLGVAALIAGGIAGWFVIQWNRIDRVELDLANVADLKPQNFLVVGSDTRELGDKKAGWDDRAIYGNGKERAPGGRRADTIVIARVDPKRKGIELLSVPRDLWITSGGTHQRINSSYNSGAQSLVDAIQENLGIPINHYLEVNFNGFKGLVDAIGGVPLYFDRPVYDEMTGLSIRKKGCYVLDGPAALAFARARHIKYSNGVRWISDPTGDLGRITRQQVFLRHALEKVSKFGLSDVDSLRVLVGVAVNNVTIDDKLGRDQMMSLASRFDGFDASKMKVHHLETTPTRTAGGASVVTLSLSDSKPVLDIFTGRAPATEAQAAPAPEIHPKDVTVDVLNGAGLAGIAGSAADDLRAQGFTIGTVGNTSPVSQTIIMYGTGGERAALLLASKISPNPDLKPDPSLAAGRVSVKLGGELTVVSGAGAAAASGGATANGASGSGGSSGVSGAAGSSTGPTVTTAPPEETIGLNIGDAPPGVTCK